mmetsp:Transcript_141479/g.439776  ORF Transcript_141479/g.439776 Transcript_141479/m.439776 type:complete len:84 (-) Transcript_141479:1012-1263(-)
MGCAAAGHGGCARSLRLVNDRTAHTKSTVPSCSASIAKAPQKKSRAFMLPPPPGVEDLGATVVLLVGGVGGAVGGRAGDTEKL